MPLNHLACTLCYLEGLLHAVPLCLSNKFQLAVQDAACSVKPSSGIYYVLGIELGTSDVIVHFHVQNKLMKLELIIFPFYRQVHGK